MPKKQTPSRRRLTAAAISAMVRDYLAANSDSAVPFKTLCRALHLNTHPQHLLVRAALDALVDEESVVRAGDNYRYQPPLSHTIEGVFVRRPNGRNSCRPTDGSRPLLVTERNSLYAMDGDTVLVAVMARRRDHAREAQVVEIVRRATDTFVGTIHDDDGILRLVPDGALIPYDILISRGKRHGAKANDKAVVRVERWPDDSNRTLRGAVIDVLGPAGENDAEMHAILAQYHLPYSYPSAVSAAARKITGAITAKDYAAREDFRGVYTCTIDPADAKDFDDALSLRRVPRDKGGQEYWEVGVHIADVSHYVRENSIIDREAQQRGTSVYLVDRTIPMLPEHLCNEVCSLRPDEEKLTFSVILTLDDKGQVVRYRLRKTVIKSCRRYTYDEVQAILVASNALGGSVDTPVGEHAGALCQLWALARQMRRRRFAAGAIAFDNDEKQFVLDDKGHPLACTAKAMVEANFLIEEFMLLANRTVAEHIGKGGKAPRTLPYRVHEAPDVQRLADLSEFVGKFGYKLRQGGSPRQIAQGLNHLITASSGTTQQRLIQTVALRAMQKAYYTVDNIGHFGLAFDYYTHFTSPIRRYPDLMVHRLLTRYAEGAPSANKQYYEEQCQYASAREVVAANAERDSIKYKAVEFMQDKVGAVFAAHITGITSYGIYCEVDMHHCEGLVPIAALDDDYYDYDDKNYCLRGRRHRHIYRLGDALQIKVLRADLDKKQLDYVLA